MKDNTLMTLLVIGAAYLAYRYYTDPLPGDWERMPPQYLPGLDINNPRNWVA